MITVTPIGPKNVTIGGIPETVASTFAIGFPQQQLSGTYTIQLGPNIQDEFGDAMDVSQTAGVNVLRGVDQNGPTTTVHYIAGDLPKPIPPSTQTDTTGQPIPGSVSSSIVVPDSFIIEGDKTAAGQSVMQVQLNLTYANDPDLTATLYHYSPSGDAHGPGRPLQQRGPGHQHGQLQQHRLRRQRRHPRPARAAPRSTPSMTPRSRWPPSSRRPSAARWA